MAAEEENGSADIWTISSLYYPQNTTGVSDLYEVYLPKRDPLSSVVPITVLYVLIFLTGLVGNICTCVVIIGKKHMHTSTNCYLFSLAVSDLLLLLIGMPQEMYQLWNRYPYVFGEAFCVLRGLASETSTNASILTITSFTVERYLAVSRPIKSQVSSNTSRAIKIIIAVWLVGAFSAAPLAFQFGVVKRHYGGREIEGTDECILKRRLPHAFEVSTFFFFVLPMCAISVLYALISLKLFRTDRVLSGEHSTSNGSCSLGNNSRQHSVRSLLQMNRQSTRSFLGAKGGASASSRGVAVKLLFAVVVAFFVCWAPFHAQRLMALRLGAESTEGEVFAYTVLTYVSGVSYFVSATINPILYSIMSVKFRRAFKDTLPTQLWFCCPSKNRRFYSPPKTISVHYKVEHSRLVHTKLCSSGRQAGDIRCD